MGTRGRAGGGGGGAAAAGGGGLANSTDVTEVAGGMREKVEKAFIAPGSKYAGFIGPDQDGKGSTAPEFVSAPKYKAKQKQLDRMLASNGFQLQSNQTRMDPYRGVNYAGNTRTYVHGKSGVKVEVNSRAAGFQEYARTSISVPSKWQVSPDNRTDRSRWVQGA